MNTECIRRPGAVWTLCPCATCRVEMARLRKRHRSGLPATADVREQAWDRVRHWVHAGYSARVVAGLTGVGIRTAEGLVVDVRRGHARHMQHVTARRIMAAPVRPTSGGGWVPSTGTVRRLRALTVMGWSMGDLASRCELAESTLHALRDPKHRTTRPQFAAVVDQLYAELADVRGPGRLAAARALRRGWLPPAAWDDVDDPTEDPSAATEVDYDEVAVERALTGPTDSLTRPERIEVARRLAGRGMSDSEIGQRLGLTDRTIIRWRTELGIESRWTA